MQQSGPSNHTHIHQHGEIMKVASSDAMSSIGSTSSACSTTAELASATSKRNVDHINTPAFFKTSSNTSTPYLNGPRLSIDTGIKKSAAIAQASVLQSRSAIPVSGDTPMTTASQLSSAPLNSGFHATTLPLNSHSTCLEEAKTAGSSTSPTTTFFNETPSAHLLIRRSKSLSFFVDLETSDLSKSSNKNGPLETERAYVPVSPTATSPSKLSHTLNQPHISRPYTSGSSHTHQPPHQPKDFQPRSSENKTSTYTLVESGTFSFHRIQRRKSKISEEMGKQIGSKLVQANVKRMMHLHERRLRLRRKAEQIRCRVLLLRQKERLATLKVRARAEYAMSAATLKRQLILKQQSERCGAAVEHAQTVAMLHKLRRLVELRKAFSENFSEILEANMLAGDTEDTDYDSDTLLGSIRLTANAAAALREAEKDYQQKPAEMTNSNSSSAKDEPVDIGVSVLDDDSDYETYYKQAADADLDETSDEEYEIDDYQVQGPPSESEFRSAFSSTMSHHLESNLNSLSINIASKPIQRPTSTVSPTSPTRTQQNSATRCNSAPAHSATSSRPPPSRSSSSHASDSVSPMARTVLSNSVSVVQNAANSFPPGQPLVEVDSDSTIVRCQSGSIPNGLNSTSHGQDISSGPSTANTVSKRDPSPLAVSRYSVSPVLAPKFPKETLCQAVRRGKVLPVHLFDELDESDYLELRDLLPPITRFTLRELDMDEVR
jgi:hypothetical protein